MTGIADYSSAGHAFALLPDASDAPESGFSDTGQTKLPVKLCRKSMFFNPLAQVSGPLFVDLL